jgi:hypothetical protein
MASPDNHCIWLLAPKRSDMISALAGNQKLSDIFLNKVQLSTAIINFPSLFS